ncbi:ADP-ribosylglycohydrolase family protein [Thermoleophilia bacterium SCSIO 60948]|nr:ADP-ribosylglycohydrolase family protein [Thermoleophilia bacterium SCSIO 60948]
MTPDPADEHLDTYRGCLMAGAVGDALGAPIEFMTIEQIRERFGPDGLTELEPAYGRLGAITDDTQMTLFTAEGLLDHSEMGPDRQVRFASMVGSAYDRWYVSQTGTGPRPGTDGLLSNLELWSRRAPGNTCLSALGARRRGRPKFADNDSKGCGGVMRTAPVGLRVWYPEAFRVGSDLAAITHGHPTGQVAAGALAALIAALRGGADLVEGVEYARSQVGEGEAGIETAAALEAAVSLVADGDPAPEKVESLGGGWVAEEALAIAVYCAMVAPDLESALRLAVNHSGDSDSTGAITGTIVGTHYGAEEIPERWLAELELRDVIEDLAARLAA